MKIMSFDSQKQLCELYDTYYAHFLDEETEGERDQMAGLKDQLSNIKEPKPCSSIFKVRTLPFTPCIPVENEKSIASIVFDHM